MSVYGTLILNSSVIYGKKKNKYKKMVISTTGEKYTVYTTILKSNYNKYVSIIKDEWDDINNVYSGNINKYIGYTNIYNDNIEFLKLSSTVFPYKTFKQSIRNVDLSPNRELINEYIFSIDPPNTNDIDDAIHIVEIRNNAYQLGVHIADVSSYIEYNSDLDDHIRDLAFSIYLPDNTFNMLPNDIDCSLISNYQKRAFTVIFDIVDGKISINRCCKSLINVTLNTTYANADTVLKNPDNSHFSNNLKLACHVCNCIFKKTYTTSHEIIADIMILTNSKIAELLHTNSNTYTLYRVNEGQSKLSKSYYSTIPNRHCMLNINHYVHFTSPMRRYGDIIIHRLLHDVLNKECIVYNTCDIVDMLNDREKKIKKIERRIATYMFVHMHNYCEFNAVVIDCIDNMLVVMINNSVILTCTLYSNKVNDILSTNLVNNCIEIIQNNEVVDTCIKISDDILIVVFTKNYLSCASIICPVLKIQ
jgi:exoribonuclease R